MDATWHARPRGSATRTRAAPTWRDTYIFIYLSYIKVFFVLPYMGRVIPLYIVGSYKPDDLLFISPCGTNPHSFYLSGDVARGGASDRAIHRSVGVDHVDTDHGSRSKHVFLKKSYNGRMR